MKLSIAFAIVFVAAMAYAAPQRPSDKDAVIVKQENTNIGVGPWSWGFETSDGTAAQEAGVIENEGTDDEAIAVRGTYQYVNSDGELIRVSWIADRNGFQPDNLPKGP
ncbi:endocuticle structural protein SgAbd-6-like [Chrysoperla carnea]|uniref:endocuticle structural protein SgAbd-6-like n=1 Tax=Chrysoperla carnea TaxID=189513 RepID=UPI001D07B068|nr:endocuticle structural protein SgAbd-6-like [Chrysoperla carnea]